MNLMGQLGSLEAAGLVRVAQVEPDLAYFFRHSLVQDAVYSALLEPDRERLHLMVGETIEQLYGDRLDEFVGMLAYHFQKAGLDEKAYTYFIKAGKAALESYANQEAETQFRQALTLVCCDSDRAELLAGLGEALYRQSRFPETLDVWRQAIELYKATGDVDGLARLYARSARVAWHAGNNPEALRLTKEGLEMVAGAPDSPDMAMLIHEAARSSLFNDLPEKAHHLCKKALKMAEAFNDIATQADTLATYGVLTDISTDEARAALQKSVALAEEAGYLGIALRAYHNLASITGSQAGGREVSRQYFKKAADLGRKRGVATEEHYSLQGALGYARAAGDLAEAESYLQRMEEITRTMADPGPADFVNRSHKAALLFMRGDWEAALALARSCYQEARQGNNLAGVKETGGDLVSGLLELKRYGEPVDDAEIEEIVQQRIEFAQQGVGEDSLYAYLHLTTLRVCQKRIPEAQIAFAMAKQRVDKEPNMWRDNLIGLTEAELASARGLHAEAISILETVVAGYARIGARWSWARTLHDWAEVHMRAGSSADLERARALLREAQTLYEQMGAQRHAAWMETRMKDLMASTYKLALVSQRDAQELARAAQVQGSFMPEEPPDIPGWELVATLEPARQTSGDFYDFIPLSNHRWGIVVADVADKGTAAALFMTTSRSLIRTYATEYEMWPEIVLSETNRRLLEDTRSGLFVTVFYAILDPANGTMIYANAGHNPPYLLGNASDLRLLTRTGTPLGVFEQATWEQSQVQMQPGDTLVIYTDGMVDAQNESEHMFGEPTLQAIVRAQGGLSAPQARDQILATVHDFVGTAPRYDDITLMVINRLPEGK
jgi:serine phosphatase RsbU (regulator of sigma subunit)